MNQDPNFPLVVDLDGTLHADDLSWLIFVAAVKASPGRFVPALWRWWRRGKADMKCWLADGVEIDPAGLAWHRDLLDFLCSEGGRGVPLYLATGTPEKVARACDEYLGKVFRGVIATDRRVNMIGRNKARALIERFGEQGFDYLGNSHQDLQVWPHARLVYLANPSRGVEQALRDRGLRVARRFDGVREV